MNELSPVQKAEAYLNIHLTREGPLEAAHLDRPFVTISRESGAGGSALASALRQRLPQEPGSGAWAVYSRNLIEEMLQTNRLPTGLSQFLPEDRIHEIDASIGELVGLHPNLWALVGKTNDFIRRLARAGNAILLGRGARFATNALPRGVHVRLVASVDYRAKRTARRLSLTESAAIDYNAAQDAARRRYVRSTFGADVRDPAAYDFVVNVEQVPYEAIAELIVRMIAQRTPRPA